MRSRLEGPPGHRAHHRPAPARRRAGRRRIAPIAHTCSFAEIERAANKAAAEADAEQGEEDRAETAAGQYLRIALEDAEHNHGYVPIEDSSTSTTPSPWKPSSKPRPTPSLAEHPTLDLDERRATTQPTPPDTTGPRRAAKPSASSARCGGRELVIYAHHDTRDPHGIVGLEGVTSSSTGSDHHRRAARRVVPQGQHQGLDPPGPRPGREPVDQPVRTHRPDAGAGHPDLPHLRVPRLRQDRPALRPRPHHPLAPGRQDRVRRTSPRCAGSTTG